METIINTQNDVFKKSKEKYTKLLTILKKNKNKLEQYQIQNLNMKLSNINNYMGNTNDLIDELLIDLVEYKCEMDETTVKELEDIRQMNKTIFELTPFLLLYQLSKNSFSSQMPEDHEVQESLLDL